MLPVLQIGPLAIRTPGLLLILGLALGLWLAERRLPRNGMKADHLYNLVFLAMLAGVLGARLSFIAQHISLFVNSPLVALSLDSSLLDLPGGLASILIAVLIYAQRKNLALLPTLDAFVPALAVFFVFLGLAHIASGEAYGAPTSLPWAIDLWGEARHPSQIYETLAALAILAIQWRKFERSAQTGNSFLIFLIMTAGARLVLEAWRGDSTILPGGFRLGQLLAWVVMAAGIFLLKKLDLTRTGEGSQNG